MLFINLLPESRRPKAANLVKPFVSAVTALSLLGVLSYFLPAAEAPVRPLTQEERQIVLALVGSISTKVPELKEWSLTFGEDFSDDSFPCFVENDLGDDGLARFEEDTIFFSPQFFGTDSVSQEKSMLRLIVDSNAPLKIDPSAEIAVAE